MYDHSHVQRSQRVGPVRNNDDNALLVPQRCNRAGKCIFAVRVEIGVRLVEYHQKWTAEYGSRQANTLALSGGQ
jgi:hypothetical protein